jgi:post-segregation antitoxin (ccd killing protein)
MSKSLTKIEPVDAEAEELGRRAELHELSAEGERWRVENAEAAKTWVDWIEKNGLPLAEYRMF